MVRDMRKTPTVTRWADEERAALDAAALDKSMSLSALVRMIVAEWLRKNGWLKRAEK